MSDAPLRILALAHDFSRANPGGSSLLRVLNTLAAHDHITCMGCGPRPDAMDARITYHRAPALRRGGMLLRFLTARRALHRHAARLLARESFDVVQALDSECDLGTVVTFHCCHAAYRATMQAAGLLTGHGLRGRLANLQICLLLRLRIALERGVCHSPRTRAIIALSAGSARDLVQWYTPRVAPVVIPNAAP